MSKERLTAEEYLQSTPMGYIYRINKERGFVYKFDIGDVVALMQAFAAQEVEAAIAETKKQRDELLAACIKMTEILNHGNYELLIPEYEVMMTAITKAEEK
jgi:hypothetical protein